MQFRSLALVALAATLAMFGCAGNDPSGPVIAHYDFTLKDNAAGTSPDVLDPFGKLVSYDQLTGVIYSMNPGDSIDYFYEKVGWTTSFRPLTFRGGSNPTDVVLQISNKPAIKFTLSASNQWTSVVISKEGQKPIEASGQEAISKAFQDMLYTDDEIKAWTPLMQNRVYVTTLRTVQQKLLPSDHLVTWWGDDAGTLDK